MKFEILQLIMEKNEKCVFIFTSTVYSKEHVKIIESSPREKGLVL